MHGSNEIYCQSRSNGSGIYFMELVEIVPNISEGRDERTVRTIASRAETVDGAYLLDIHMDAWHNRSVLTFAARPEAAVAACLALMSACIEHIDLREHAGVHPRIGALDVVPFVPLYEVSMARCIALAKDLGRELASRFQIPVFLYGAASEHQPPLELSTLRRGGGFEALAHRLAIGELRADFGPSTPHASAGAVASGARGFLIAYNVNLRASDLSTARQIAAKIRTSNGGLPHLKALGFSLAQGERTQVSMNLTDFRQTSLLSAFTAVRAEACARGVEVDGSELVGLVPEAACFDDMESRLMLERPPGILEARMRARNLV